MSLSVTTLERVFKFSSGNEDVILPDPNSDMSPDEVMDFYSTKGFRNGSWKW